MQEMNLFRRTVAGSMTVFLIAVLPLLSWGQKFDEQFEHWPVDLKVGGTIIAGGGGEMPASALEMFLARAESDESNAVVLGFDSLQELEKKIQAEAPGKIKMINVDRDANSIADAELDALNQASTIWVELSQRPNKKQAQVLKQVLGVAKSVVAKRGLVCLNGPAVEWMGKYKTETEANLTATQSVSNLIPDTVLLSGYRHDRDRSELLSVLAKQPRCIGIGIEENTAILLRGRKIRVLGEGEATFCMMANEQLPLRVQHVRMAKSRRSNPYKTIVDLTAWRREAIDRTLAPFPAKVPPTPSVENGTLIIVGGGGMPRGLMERMVEMAGGKDAKMVYVPCSESDEIKGPQRMVETWKRMGVKSAAFIHTKDRNKANSDDEFLEPLKDATGIWFGGGRQWNFCDSYYGTEAHRLMKEVLARGGVIGGSSAGASVQGCYMCRANPVANFDIMAPGYERGLGFIGGVAIDQHFSQRGRQKDMTQLVDRYPQLLGIGLDEATAIIVQKSQAKVVGRGKVHFYDRNIPVVPGTDDFIALKNGAIFDLAKREIVEKESKDE